MKLHYILLLIIVVSFGSCIGGQPSLKNEPPYIFSLQEELGVSWDFPMVKVDYDCIDNKGFENIVTIDNHSYSEEEKKRAVMLDIIDLFTNDDYFFFEYFFDEPFERVNHIRDTEWSDGPMITCKPVKYRNEWYETIVYKSKRSFAGEKPQFDNATLGAVELTKVCKGKKAKAEASQVFDALVKHFNSASNLKPLQSLGNYSKWTDGVSNVGVYLSYKVDGTIIKDTLHIVHLDFVSVVQN